MFINWTAALSQKLFMIHIPLGEGSSFAGRWQMILLPNSTLFTETMNCFQCQPRQFSSFGKQKPLKLHNKTKCPKNVLGKKSTKHKKAKGARISNKSLPTVINSWLWSQRERKARGLGRVSLTQQHSSENLRWPHGELLWKGCLLGSPVLPQSWASLPLPFSGAEHCWKHEALAHVQGQDSLKSPGQGSCELTILLSDFFFFFFGRKSVHHISMAALKTSD